MDATDTCRVVKESMFVIWFPYHNSYFHHVEYLLGKITLRTTPELLNAFKFSSLETVDTFYRDHSETAMNVYRVHFRVVQECKPKICYTENPSTQPGKNASLLIKVLPGAIK